MNASSLERTALKEWAVLIDAMARGEIWALVRKGGIREQRAGFALRHDRFLLYPTFFHERDAELAPRFRARLAASLAERPPAGIIRLRYVAHVAASWWVTDLESLHTLDDAWGLDWSAVDSRFHYRGRPGVYVLALDVRRLAQPAALPEVRRYGGCVSWVELDDAVNTGEARSIFPAAEVARRVARLEARLGAPAAV